MRVEPGVRPVHRIRPGLAQTLPKETSAAVAYQFDIEDPGVLAGYRDIPMRCRHTAEIRDRYGYRDFAARPGRFAVTAWVYRQAWAGEVASSVLFRAARRQLPTRRILLSATAC